MRHRALLLVVLLVALAAALAVSAAQGRQGALQPHPRLLLDPKTLAQLRARAKAGTPEWKALKARCDDLLTGTVEWPDGNDYPSSNSIGEGYQGDGYLPAMLAIGLCYQTALGLPGSRSPAYAAKGVDLLTKMTAPSGPHAPEVTRDSGYGIRDYVPAIALGYDWLYPALSSALRSRIFAALHRWIASYEAQGFEREFPQGNYFAGYYNAKALAALATEGDDPQAESEWQDWLTHVQGKLVQPYYAANLSGGGWPEGWNYGAFGSWNMSLPTLAVLTAKGVNLVRNRAAPFTYPVNDARFLLYFTWPDLKTMEDSDFAYDGDNPTPTHPYLVTFESALLARLHDPLAPYFHSYARAVRKVEPGGDFGANWDEFVNFLFWNRKAKERNFRTLKPLSYYAKGIEMAAVRSSWKSSAVWAEFKSGPYTNYPENGEELFDQGSLAIVNGKKPFLVNAWGALVRNTLGTSDGSPLWQKAYDDVLGDGGGRDIFNVFYVSRPQPEGQGQYLRSDGAKTSISAFHDARSYVVMQGTHLEDDYPREPDSPKTIKSWNRDVVYLRPNVFVVHDSTTVTDPSIDQWMAWHFMGKPQALGAGRYRLPGGTVQSVLPAGASEKVVDVFDAHKVYRVEVHAGGSAASHEWITVFVAGSTSEWAQPISVAGGVGVSVAGRKVEFLSDGRVTVSR